MSCSKKQAVEPLVTHSTTDQHKNRGLKKVHTKDIILSNTQLIDAIGVFKSRTNVNSKSSIVNTDSLYIDSAVFVLEAALNFDYSVEFSDPAEPLEVVRDFDIPSNPNHKVSTNDLQDIYEMYKSSIDSLINDTTVINVVDIEAFDFIPAEGNIRISGKVILSSAVIGCKKETTCLFSLAIDPTLYQNVLGCSSPYNGCGNLFVPKLFKSYLNCSFPAWEGCNNGILYSNVSLVTLDPTINSSFSLLLLTQFWSSSVLCTNATVFSPNQAWTTMDALKNYVIPNVPTGKNFVKGSIYLNSNIQQSGTNNYRLYWTMDFLVANINCRTFPLN